MFGRTIKIKKNGVTQEYTMWDEEKQREDSESDNNAKGSIAYKTVK